MRVALINYLNSLPYVYAIEKHRHLFESILVTPPSGCARLFLTGEVDVVLLPIATLKDIQHVVRLPYGIAAKDNVKSVVLASTKPLSEIKRILLDPESATSNSLIKILCKHYWNIHPVLVNDISAFWDARLLIGDKTFSMVKEYAHVYDLAKAWHDFTGLPMVFARWVARPELPEQTLSDFLSVLHFAVQYKNESLKLQNLLSYEEAYDYINNFIQYELDEECLLSENQFFSLLKQSQ